MALNAYQEEHQSVSPAESEFLSEQAQNIYCNIKNLQVYCQDPELLFGHEDAFSANPFLTI